MELANILGVGERKIRYNMKDLIDKNYIERIGSSKTGEWKVIIKGSEKLCKELIKKRRQKNLQKDGRIKGMKKANLINIG